MKKIIWLSIISIVLEISRVIIKTELTKSFKELKEKQEDKNE